MYKAPLRKTYSKSDNILQDATRSFIHSFLKHARLHFEMCSLLNHLKSIYANITSNYNVAYGILYIWFPSGIS